MIPFQKTTILFICITFPFLIKAQDILTKLHKVFPGAEITELEKGKHFVQEFEILLNQQLDHDDKNTGTFRQRVFLSHYDEKAPNLLVTEGYRARHQYYELCEILRSNQFIVEHRFFGESKPENYDYQYLTNDQAIEDLHYIRKQLGKIYKNRRWVSTGISKGGTSCLIYRSKYPKDVKVSVPYVAPLPMSQSDARCDNHILSRGSEDCRKRLDNFQKNALKYRDVLLPKVDSLAKADNLTFERVGYKGAFEYAVLEFTFSFWQWGHDCDRIKDDLSPHQIFELLKEVVGYDFYSDETIAYFEPSFYQFMRENGYYSFIHDHLKEDIKELKSFDNRIFAPQGEDLSFEADYLKRVRVWLYHNGDKIIHIQGGNDPWGACGFVPPKGQDALNMIKKEGDHFTRIASFDTEDREKIYSKLKKWLKTEIYPLKDDKFPKSQY